MTEDANKSIPLHNSNRPKPPSVVNVDEFSDEEGSLDFGEEENEDSYDRPTKEFQISEVVQELFPDDMDNVKLSPEQ